MNRIVVCGLRETLRGALMGSVGCLAVSSVAFAQSQTSPTPSAPITSADAKPAAANYVDEIVVTANRRAESVQRAPSAITAIGQKELEVRGIDSFEGFARSVPGLTMNQATKNRAMFNIRGIATSTAAFANTQDPVSVYINDTPVTDTYGAPSQPDLRLFDVERIEVLRGPQGTLFGSGSLGGTVRIITNKPDATGFAAEGRVDFGTTEGGGLRQRYDGMVNIPLIDDKLALRVVGYYRDEGGWVKNLALGTRNDTLDWGGRAALRWTPTDALTVRSEIFHQESSPDDSDGWDPAYGKYRKSSPIAEGRSMDLTNYNLAVDYDFTGFATLTSSSTYQKNETAFRRNLGSFLGAGTPLFLNVADPWTSRFYVQELRLVSNTESRFQWVAGVFYVDRKTAIPDYVLTAPGIDAMFGGAIGSDLYFDTDITTRSTELAAYADGSYEIVSGLKLRGGLRVFKTTADYVEKNRIALNFATLAYDAPLSFANHGEEANNTWRFGLSYEPTRGRLFFANVSKGFRVGQANANFGPSAIDPNDYVIPEGYKPDSTINYEVGAKTTLFDGDVTFNLTGFYIDWKDIQIDGTRISDVRAFIANAGKASVKGVEAEVVYRPTYGLSLYATATLQDGKIDSVPSDIIIPAAKGDRLPGLARTKLSGGFEYRWDVSGENQAYVRLDGQYTDTAPNSFANGGRNLRFTTNDDFSSLDASMGLDTAWGNVAVYGENLTDNDAFILKDLGTPNGFGTLRPRTFGIRLTYKH